MSGRQEKARARQAAAASQRLLAALGGAGALLVTSLNKMVFLGFSYAAALAATAVMAYLNRLAKTTFFAG